MNTLLYEVILSPSYPWLGSKNLDPGPWLGSKLVHGLVFSAAKFVGRFDAGNTYPYWHIHTKYKQDKHQYIPDTYRYIHILLVPQKTVLLLRHISCTSSMYQCFSCMYLYVFKIKALSVCICMCYNVSCMYHVCIACIQYPVLVSIGMYQTNTSESPSDGCMTLHVSDCICFWKSVSHSRYIHIQTYTYWYIQVQWYIQIHTWYRQMHISMYLAVKYIRLFLIILLNLLLQEIVQEERNLSHEQNM
jgi:hypothetical protein